MGRKTAAHSQLALALMWTIILATVTAAAAQALPGCPNTCGEIEVPYPFGKGLQPGTGRDCFYDQWFNLTCQNSELYYRDDKISNISIQGQLEMSMNVSRICYNESGGTVADEQASLSTLAFTVSSTENKFVSVGCDTYGYLHSYNSTQTYSTGCISICDRIPDEKNTGHCSGIGCCQVDIPVGFTNITVDAYSFKNQRNVMNFNNCSYSFVARNGFFEFSTSDLKNLPFDKAPVVIDWYVWNGTCETARNRADYACTANSECEDYAANGFGYRCNCKTGFGGNPYHPDGCHTINECNIGTHTCISEHSCRDIYGSFECYCPPGYSGNGTKEGGCQRSQWEIKVVIGVSAGLLALFFGVSWLYFVHQKRKVAKLKEKFFHQNGGFILQQHLAARDATSQTAKIFTSEELKKATNNYDERLIIGRGGSGTVFKGFLSNNEVVAIKKSKIVDQSLIEQFINEMVVLSQINHRNVVKLLGCCLETEVPLLVYEYVNNGTLLDFIHNKNKDPNVSLETRLLIAAETAGALSYLHSAASIPIIHRDVKSTNILLDETYTAKVSDFGASRLIPLDQTELATMVQGTLGYLDPEYMLTSQLTEKSDVYSFGVVLAELLTGKKALSFDRPEEERSLAMHFLCSLNQDRLFEVVEVGIVNEENRQIIKEVAALAARCLRLKGDERPFMKEVSMEMEGMKMIKKPSCVDKELNLEETESLLQETSPFSECVDSNNYNKNTGYNNMTHLIDFDDGR